MGLQKIADIEVKVHDNEVLENEVPMNALGDWLPF